MLRISGNRSSEARGLLSSAYASAEPAGASAESYNSMCPQKFVREYSRRLARNTVLLLLEFGAAVAGLAAMIKSLGG